MYMKVFLNFIQNLNPINKNYMVNYIILKLQELEHHNTTRKGLTILN